MKRTTLLSALVLLIASASFAGLEKEKKWSKTYSINSDATLELESFFGDIQMENWDKNEISIEIIFVVSGKKDESVLKALEKCTVEESGSKSLVSIETHTGDWGNRIDKMETNITIKAPKGISLDLEHQFGDASLPIFEGAVTLDIQHGDVRVEAMKSKDNDIELSFSDGIFGKITAGTFDLQHSDLKLHTIQAATFGVQFSDVKIKNLGAVLLLDSQHSDVEVLNVSSDIERIEADLQFGSLDLTMSQSANWKLEGDFSFSNIDLPSGVKSRKSEEESWSNNFEIQAFHGSAEEVNIEIDAQHSSVNIAFE